MYDVIEVMTSEERSRCTTFGSVAPDESILHCKADGDGASKL